MRKRKTVAVTEAVAVANRMLANSTGTGRQGIIVLIETLLHESGNYRGFRYLEAHEVPAGQLPGIIPGETNAENQYPDDTRRAYYGEV